MIDSKSLVVRAGTSLRNRSQNLGDVVGAFESETSAVFFRTAPANEHIILYVLVGIFLVSVLFCAVVKLDKVVTGNGRIVPSTGQLYVSPFDTGIIKAVNVKVGDIVRKGQALATLDATFTEADLKQLQQKLSSDEAAVARDEAEMAGRPYRAAGSEPSQVLQGNIYVKRQAEYHFNIANYNAQERNTESQVAQFRADSEEYTKRRKLADDVQKTYKPLLDKGYVSKLQLMQAADSHTEISRLLGDADAQVSALEQTLAAVRAQRDAYIQKWHSDIGSQLVIDRNDLDETRQRLQKARKLSELISLEAPANAIVLKIGKVSSGSVAGGGGQESVSVNAEPLFTLMPLDTPLDADINVDSADLGFIKVGDPVQLKLDAYRFMAHGTAKGIVRNISEGSFTTDLNNSPVAPYFKVRVTIKEVRLHSVPADFRLIPGMTLAGDIMVGRRTILSYLVEGALRTGSEAMREP